MKLYSVTFDDSDVVSVEPGVEVRHERGSMFVDLGTDVGGATLAMIPYRIPLVDFASDDPGLQSGGGATRLVEAEVIFGDEEHITFRPETRHTEDRAFVVLSVIQRSPDARTEVMPFGAGVECIGNAFDRPMDRQVLIMRPRASVQFRRFSRGGNVGPWERVTWSGERLDAERVRESTT